MRIRDLALGALIIIAGLLFMFLRTNLSRHPLVTPTATTSLLAASTEPTFPPCPDFTTQRLLVGQREINVALADSPAERMRGLSGCSSVPADSGMYFVLGSAHPTAFWMKDMLMPLDIIWLANGQVTGLVPAAPMPSPGQTEDQLPQYRSPGPVDAVLELPAGQASALGLKIGTTIKPF